MNRQMLPLPDPEGIHPALNPAILSMLEQVVDDAWKELVATGSPVATGRGEGIARKIMAFRAFFKAGHGELDPNRLKKYVLCGFSAGLARSP